MTARTDDQLSSQLVLHAVWEDRAAFQRHASHLSSLSSLFLTLNLVPTVA